MLTIRLFGGASIEGPDGPLTGRVSQRRPLALLALLAAQRTPATSRDRLLLLLAPESDTERGRHLLRDTVYAVRSTLGSDAIIAAGDELRLNHEVVTSDVREFETALNAGDLAHAVALRRGAFLDGFHLRDSPDFEEWTRAERDRLDDACAGALETLAATALGAGDPAAAARWLGQRLLLDPLNARATMALMTALHESGDVAGALRRAATHAALLRSELDCPPDPSVQELAEQFRTRPVPQSARASASVSDDVAAAAGATSTATLAPPTQTPLLTRRARRAPTLLAAAAVAVVVLIVAARGATARAEPALDARRVAVAPLRNATGNVQLDALGSMAADWITQGLTRTALLEVVPTHTVIGSVRRQQASGPYAGDDSVPFRGVGEWTGAGTVVFGSYYQEGDELIFQVQIADASQGVVIAALAPVHAPRATPLAGIEELLHRTLAALGPLLDPRTTATAALSSRPPSFAAYRDYAEGLELFIAGELHAATRSFERAAATDPDYTLPLLWAALARWNSGDLAGGDSLARQLAASAGRLAPLDEAIMRSILAWASGDHAAAYDAAARAHHAAPGSGMAAAQLAVEALRLNRPAEARRILGSLDPDRGEMRGWVFYWQDLGESLHIHGRHREELKAAAAARARHPDTMVPRLVEIRALAARGRADAVHTLLDDVLAGPTAPHFAALGRQAAQEFVAHGHPQHAATVLQRAVAWSRSRLEAEPDNVALRRGLARLLMMQGDDAAAAHLLEIMPPTTHGPSGVDEIGLAALLAERSGQSLRADSLLHRLETAGLPYINGRDAWWRAAVTGARGDCDAALDALRAGLARGVPFGMDLLHAHELQPLRSCPGWAALVRPRG